MMQISLKDTEGGEGVQQGIAPYTASHNPFEMEQKQPDFMLMH